MITPNTEKEHLNSFRRSRKVHKRSFSMQSHNSDINFNVQEAAEEIYKRNAKVTDDQSLWGTYLVICFLFRWWEKPHCLLRGDSHLRKEICIMITVSTFHSLKNQQYI